MARRKRIRRHWPAVLQAQVDSGLTVKEFCRQQGIPRSLFHKWRRRLQAASDSEPSTGFIELRPVDRRLGGSGVALVTEAGWRLEVEPDFDAATLQRVLACVAQSATCSR